MLQLTKRTEYALIALVHMADRQDEAISVRELCERYPLPRRLVAEVLKDLVHVGLVASHRGAQGGYSLAVDAERISLGRIISAMEGAPAITNCETIAHARDGGCEVHPICPIRSPIEKIQELIWRQFEATTLRSLVPAPNARRNEVIQRLRESIATGASL